MRAKHAYAVIAVLDVAQPDWVPANDWIAMFSLAYGWNIPISVLFATKNLNQ